MRAETKKKHKMGKRFAIVICVGAAGVMALGAQTAGAAATYNTRLTIENEARYHDMYGLVYSGGGKKCEVGRRVTLFKQQPGADRKIVDVRSGSKYVPTTGPPAGSWFSPPPQGSLPVKPGWRVYAKATPKVRDGFVCRGDRSPIWKVHGTKKVPKASAGTVR